MKTKREVWSQAEKDACKKCIHELLSLGMPVVEDTPLEFRLSIASIIGATGALSGKYGNEQDSFLNKASIIMAYLSQTTDEEIMEIIRESKAGAN